jgi:pre-mRNA-processing factor SLU7
MATPAPAHITESISDRKKSRELAEARQSGQVAPAVDVKTGAMINPHNPEFITKRPWYLGDGDAGPSLDHQADPTRDQVLLSMQSADALVKQEREKFKEKVKKQKMEVGMWVEAMRHGKGPYIICQIVKIAKKGTVFDLKHEDGTLERKVKFKPSSKSLYKPRIRMTKTGARSMVVDEKIHGKESYDSKRDKYHGYDPDSHTKKVSRVFSEREEIRKRLRQEKQEKEDQHGKKNDQDEGKQDDDDNDSDSDADSDVGSDSDDEFRDEDERVITTRLARQGGVGGAQMKVTARNLRIREDTAKYLRNLDPNSAYYDPKSRSMRDNPHPEVSAEDALFAGDNFARISGDAVNLAETQLFAWDATEKSATTEMHPQANPSQVELLKKKFQNKSADIQIQKKRKVLDKYGGQEYLDGSGGLANISDRKKPEDLEKSAQERKIRFGVSVEAEQYSKDGRLLQGAGAKQRAAPVPQKSKYEEDVFINSHTTVWGSYFHVGAFQWGYADDHSLTRSSYCTGLAGRKANDEAHEIRFGTGMAGSAALAQARGMLKALPKGKNGGGNSTFETPSSRSRLYGEADPNAKVDQNKVKEVLEKMNEDEKQSKDDHKRKYNSMNAEVDVTEEQMEAYRLRKERGDDPMSKISSDELLDYK